jgi:SAM-dependent methyltransferase
VTQENSNYYDRSGFVRLAEVENRHFWFIGRKRLICWAIGRYFPSITSFCDAGCGTGAILRTIEREFPDVKTVGLDIYPEGLEIARRSLRRTTLLHGDVLALPSPSDWDAIGAFDVLEHIPDDEAALRGIAMALKPRGGLILTVPQHPALWSAADEIGHHQRRYERHELIGKVERAGFRILRLTSFVSFLLPVLWLNRRRVSSAEDAFDELRLSRPLNLLFGATLSAERGLIRAGVSLPAGGSLLLIGAKA